MQHSELTEKIIACAYTVYNKMGYGYLESVYERCMLIELADVGLNAEAQKRLKVHYKGQIVGDFVTDIIVNDTVIVELKSVSEIVKAHEIQLVNYLVSTNKPVGLILNFAKDKVEIKRKVKDL
jgi:GxxExxY protein